MKKSLICLVVLLLTHLPIIAFCQKLPNVQKNSQRLPANYKIDGKTTEWGGAFQAFNTATLLYYTMSNDDMNLYLTVQSNDVSAVTKLTRNGLVLTINPLGKKSNDNAMSITFPVFDPQYGNKFSLNISALKRDQNAVDAANKKLHENEKYIKTTGLKKIDTLLSIYNRDGIKVAEAFDLTGAYTYELLVPLKYLNLPAKAIKKIAYHILIPKLDMEKDIMKTNKVNNVIEIRFPDAAAVVPKPENMNDMLSTTDFWGEYTLTNK